MFERPAIDFVKLHVNGEFFHEIHLIAVSRGRLRMPIVWLAFSVNINSVGHLSLLSFFVALLMTYFLFFVWLFLGQSMSRWNSFTLQNCLFSIWHMINDENCQTIFQLKWMCCSSTNIITIEKSHLTSIFHLIHYERGVFFNSKPIVHSLILNDVKFSRSFPAPTRTHLWTLSIHTMRRIALTLDKQLS